MKKAPIAAAALLCVSLTGCSMNKERTYTDYIQSVLDCSYLCETEKYAELTDATRQEAEDVYYAQVEYVTWLICNYNGVVIDYLSDDTYYDFEDLAMRVMERVSYTVEPAVKSGSTYHVTVVVEPIDFLDITIDAVNDLYLDEFEDRFNAFDYSDADALDNDASYIALEDEYGQRVLDVLYGYVDQIGYYGSESIIVEITEDGDTYGISEKNWLDIDDLLLGLDENT